MTNRTQNKDADYITGLILAVVSIVCFLVDVTYIAVCFKALRKSFHHLQILTLCVCDTILTLPLALYGFSKMTSFLEENIKACRFQLLLVFYGYVVQYNIQLLLCLRRFYALKTFNFGKGQLKWYENNKYKIVLITMFIPFVLETVLTLTLPYEDYVEDCSPPYLYGKFYKLFIGLNIAPVTICIIIIVILYLTGACIVWKHISIRKVLPAHDSESRNKDVEQNADQTKITLTPQTTRDSTRVGCSVSNEGQRKHVCLLDKRVLSMISLDKNIEVGKINKISLVDIEVVPEGDISTQQRRNFVDIQETGVIKCYHDPSKMPGKESQKGNGKNKAQIKSYERTDWEIHAFVTCVIIALQTIALTGPLLLAFWSEIVTGRLLQVHEVLILSIPHLINSISNPFIYYWRVPEIRQAFKKLFRKSDTGK